MTNNIMLDLETMGNRLSSAIIAIGAVRFDDDLADRFYTSVSLKSCIDAGLTMDAPTVLWWMRQSDEARQLFNDDNADLDVALRWFSEWVGDDPVIWGNGSDFDNVILANAYSSISEPVPWEYWNNRCYRTVKAMHADIEYRHAGTRHHAADDATSQARHLLKIMDKTRSESSIYL